MEAFFSREVQRLEFVSKRASLREAEKKQMDTAKENKEQVSLLVLAIVACKLCLLCTCICSF